MDILNMTSWWRQSGARRLRRMPGVFEALCHGRIEQTSSWSILESARLEMSWNTMENFNPYMNGIDVGFWRELCQKEGKLRHYDAGEFFLEAGKTARFAGFVKTGTLKYVANDPEGNEHIINLEFAGEFVADFPDSIYGLPSKVSVIANSPCEIYCVPTAALRDRISTDREFHFIVARTSEQLFEQVYTRLIESYTISPRQGYQQLVARYPYLFEMFQLQDIASYLKITPTHLSRIRREMLSEK